MPERGPDPVTPFVADNPGYLALEAAHLRRHGHELVAVWAINRRGVHELVRLCCQS